LLRDARGGQMMKLLCLAMGLFSASALDNSSRRLQAAAQTCTADLNGDLVVGVVDLLDLLASFGDDSGTVVGDINGDGVVGVQDLLNLLSEFGRTCLGAPPACS
jgi:hypothetical protein